MAAEQRLIDVDAQIASIKKQYCAPCKEHGQDYNEVRCRSCWVDDGIDFLEDAPTVDAVEVVRCKDCKDCDTFYPRKEIGKEPIQVWYCNRYRCHRDPDDFCSHGERRTDDVQ